jgi:hypothetical protein
MKFNIFFTLRGPAGQIEVPNTFNPVEAPNLKAVLLSLYDNKLPSGLVETVGLRIEPVNEGKEKEQP